MARLPAFDAMLAGMVEEDEEEEEEAEQRQQEREVAAMKRHERTRQGAAQLHQNREL